MNRVNLSELKIEFYHNSFQASHGNKKPKALPGKEYESKKRKVKSIREQERTWETKQRARKVR